MERPQTLRLGVGALACGAAPTSSSPTSSSSSPGPGGLAALALSIIATWLFAESRGSVLVSILFHLMANHANDLTGVSFEVFPLAIVVCALALIAGGALRGSAPESARVSLEERGAAGTHG